MPGKVYLVGAGPGHPELITVRGVECLKEADVVLYDRLVHPQILHYTQPNCELIFAGKFPKMHVLRQEKINELLIEKAMENKTVVRLKGGDPAVFGRVGEEARDLKERNIEFEIVPGITSGIAASTFAGIPVTHREYGETFAIVTGHDKSKEGKPLIPWQALAEGMDTIAFYMGIKNLQHNCQQLIQNGKPKETKVAVIQWGTMGSQQTVTGTLETIVQCVEESNISNPAIVLVGNVVDVRDEVKWFEKKPLFHQSILVAKASAESGTLAKELLRLGADVVEFPKFYFHEKGFSPFEWEKMIRSFESFVFTSKQSVDVFFNYFYQLHIDIRELTQQLYVQSMMTKKHLATFGLHAEMVTESLEDALYFGDEGVLKHPHGWVLFEQKVNKEYTTAITHWLKHKKYSTVVFPNERSVQMLMKEKQRANLSIEIDHAFCMGEKAKEAIHQLGLSSKETNHKETNRFLEEIVRQLT
ncbi:uroporphyrinogen-III C-methyltransferase [Massilibacterium senegalense]|uniref:uroporphyrinogen-III C-methyltransferase n=1 Tax=Massilibacterium senegalense TaxID=1632858 RepID=UPI00078047F9|nr:uroporphyrinogen-III C-methyltransferase [Massilibacterium senegalense]